MSKVVVHIFLCSFESNEIVCVGGCTFPFFLIVFISVSSLYLEWPPEREKVKKAADHCRQILNYVNQAVKEAENKQVKRRSKICRMGISRIWSNWKYHYTVNWWAGHLFAVNRVAGSRWSEMQFHLELPICSFVPLYLAGICGTCTVCRVERTGCVREWSLDCSVHSCLVLVVSMCYKAELPVLWVSHRGHA